MGPNPWQHEMAEKAMEEAEHTVEAYVRAGFQKIHLDASMACADDPEPLSGEAIARRAARLCAVAEQARGEQKPLYVIGTEVPTPGGATENLNELAVTSREAAVETLATHRRVFCEARLEHVWPRVIALVVQPGVEFNHDRVIDYDSRSAAHLTALLDDEQRLVYEAHSTDYQRPQAYRQLVRDGFAILKVGPALTFAMREALTDLAKVEAELVPHWQASHLADVLERVMLDKPANWQHHYPGNGQVAHLLRRYSYSDRVRYYWNEPRVKDAVDVLIANPGSNPIPETLLSCFLPDEYRAVRAGTLRSDAHSLILHRIRGVLRPYAAACG